MRRHRLAIGLALLGAALLIIGYAFLWTSMGWPWDGYHWLAAPGTTSLARSVPAAGVSLVAIDARQAAAVQVQTQTGSSIRVSWSSAGVPARVLSLSRHGDTLSIVFTPPAAVYFTWSLFRQPTAVLDVTLPPGLVLTSDQGTGSLAVRGTYHQLKATVQVGTLYVSQFQGALQAAVGTGALGVEGATIDGPLILSTRLGVVDFWGDPGISALIQDNLGSINLRIHPSGRLAVTVRVGFGSFTTAGFAGLSGADHAGVFVGAIGHGPSGTLSVSSLGGGVSLVPYQP